MTSLAAWTVGVVATAAAALFACADSALLAYHAAEAEAPTSVGFAERERQLSIARSEENSWLVQDHQNQTKRPAFEGALDVDVVFSPFFNALPIRRTGIYRQPESLTLPVVYLRLPDLSVELEHISYSSADVDIKDGIKVVSPVADTVVTVDDDGFILDYPGLAERI